MVGFAQRRLAATASQRGGGAVIGRWRQGLQRGLVLALASASLVGCATLAPRPARRNAPFAARAVDVVQGTGGPRVRRAYRVFVPPGAPPAEGWPVILFLHGGGEMGDDNQRPVQVGLGPEIARRVEAGAGFPFLVVFPQCPRFGLWSLPEVERAALAALDDAVGALAGDPRRVFVVGNSMGGFGAWALAARNPQRFAAVVPVAAAVVRPGWTPYPDAARLAPRGVDPRPPVAAAIAGARLPVWIFSGEDDPVEPWREGQRMHDLLAVRGLAPLRLTVWPHAGHAQTWERTYAGPALWSWLLSLPRSR